MCCIFLCVAPSDNINNNNYNNNNGLCCRTDFEKVIDFGNMYRAYRKSKCGKGFKNSSAKFSVMALDGINTLIEQLKSKTYKISAYNEFKVYEPKERVIKTTSFKDKVVQHSLCDNVILPRLQKVFIKDNCLLETCTLSQFFYFRFLNIQVSV